MIWEFIFRPKALKIYVWYSILIKPNIWNIITATFPHSSLPYRLDSEHLITDQILSTPVKPWTSQSTDGSRTCLRWRTAGSCPDGTLPCSTQQKCWQHAQALPEAVDVSSREKYIWMPAAPSDITIFIDDNGQWNCRTIVCRRWAGAGRRKTASRAWVKEYTLYI